MPEDSRFAVVLAKAVTVEPIALAKALAAVRKTPLQDQMIAARSAWGVIAESLSEADASTLVSQLQPTIECRSLPVSEMATLPPIVPLTRLEVDLAKGLILVAAAAVTVTSTSTKTIKEGPTAGQKMVNMGILMTTGLPIKIGGKERSVDKKVETSDLLYYLDLVYADPPRRRRLDAQKFDYSGLGARKLYSVLGNFKTVLGDLAREAPSASRNHGSRVFLENKPIPTMGYGSLHDLEREERWLLTLRSHPPTSTK